MNKINIIILFFISASFLISCKEEPLPGVANPQICKLKSIGQVYDIINKKLPLNRFIEIDGMINPSGLLWEAGDKKIAIHKFMGGEGKLLAYFELKNNEHQPPLVSKYKGILRRWRQLDEKTFNDKVKKQIEDDLIISITTETYVLFVDKRPEGCL